MAVLMPDGRRRSREGWADAMEDGPPATPAHTHRLPKAVRLAIVGLVGAVFLLLVALIFVVLGLLQAREYIEGRGEYRDREAARMEAETTESIRQAQCDLLDTFPADVPALERARAKYRCGPGIPVELLTPEERSRVEQRSKPAAAPSSPVSPPPPLGSAAQPGVEQPVPNTPTPEPSAEPSPTVDLGRITDRVCDLADVCN